MANFNFKINYCLFSYLICFCGFLYQFVDLYSGYMSGKTVVNIKVETIINQTLPGITVCYPSYFILETLKVNDNIAQQFKKNYQDANVKIELFGNQSRNYSKLKALTNELSKIKHNIKVLFENLSMVDFFEM